MNVVVIGNGAVGLMIAREVLTRERSARVTIVAPESRPGCASTAAAAMFNSFAEVDVGTMHNPFEKSKWLFNRLAAPKWPNLLAELRKETAQDIQANFGTYVINNHVSDTLEDRNFEAILSALGECKEPFQFVPPSEIPFYKPSSPGRAGRAIFIPAEGWVNPVHLLAALTASIHQSGRAEFIDGMCARFVAKGSSIESAHLTDGRVVQGDLFVLSPGANFSQIVDASDLGLKFPRIFYGVGCTLILGTGSETLTNCVRTPNRGLACGIYSAPRDPTHTIIGASNFISPVPATYARLTSVYTLLKSAMEQINRDYYRADLVATNVGWRPTSEDTLPMIGRTDITNFFVATGTKRDGLHCSPVIAECMVDLMTTKQARHDISLFKPDRTPVKTHQREDAIETTVDHIMNAAYQHDFVPAKNRMLEEMRTFHRRELEALHDQVGAVDWGIPPELVNMYKYGHIKP